MLKTLFSEPQERLFQLKSTAKRWSCALATGLLLLAGLEAQAQALSGAYTINSAVPTGGTNFATFSEVASRLSLSGVSGPVTIAVSGGPYTEQFSLGVISGSSATNTVVINGGGSTLQFASANTNQRAVVMLNGADYVTIDNLIINAAGGTYGYGIQLTSNADYNRITNNTINGDLSATSTNFAGIVVSGSATSATTTGDTGSNLIIQGNTVNGGYYGIALQGNSTTALNPGNIVRNNTVRDFYYYGIYSGYQDGAQFIGNDIARPLRTSVSLFYGIYLFGSSRSAAIEKNRIHNAFDGNPTSTSSLYGIYVVTSTGATATTPNDVVNNTLYNLSGSGPQYLIYSSSAAYTRIYNNTVNSDDQATATTSLTYGIYCTGANNDVKNNVVSITRAGTGTKYGLYYSQSTTTSNYNDSYVPNGNLGYYSAAYTTLPTWQTANGGAFDQNSVSADPIFAGPSTGNLIPGNSQLNNAGTPLTRVTDDITGAARGATPDLGAYEFTPVAIDLASAGLVGPATTSSCYGTAEPIIVQVRNGGANTLNFATNPATVTVVVTPPSGAAQTFTTTVNTGTLASAATQNITLTGTLNMAALGTYGFAVTATVTGDLNTTNDVLVPAPTRTVVAPVAGSLTPTASDLCVSGSITLTLTGSANGLVQWQQSTNNTTFTDIVGATSSTFTTPVLTSTTYYRVRTGCNTNSALSNVTTITVNNPQVASVVTPVTVCAGGTATLTATGSAGTTLRYFDAATGGTALGTGASFTTPAITASRQYYVEAFIGQATTAGPTTNTFGAAAATNLTYGLIFSVNSPTTLNGVYVYPGTAGSINIEYQNSANAVIQSTTATFTTADVGVKTYVPLNFALQPGTGFRLMMISSTGGATISRNTAGASYPYTSGNGNVSITGNTFTGYPQYYYYFYDWQIGGECISATRTPIQVNVPVTASFPATAASTCSTTPYQLAGTIAGSATTGTYTTSGTGTFSPNATTLNATYTPSTADVTAGSVTITLTSAAAAPCPGATATVVLTISRPAVATFSYPATGGNCAGSTGTVSPTLGTGATAGTFTSTTGLAINATTGVVSLANSAAGTYTVTNTATNGSCTAATATATITVNPTPTRPTLTPTYNGTVTTLTSSSATGNQFYFNGVAIAGATGQTYVINGSTATYGAYTVVVTNSFGCASQASVVTTVTTTRSSIGGVSLLVYPNPTPDGRLTLELTGTQAKASQLEILNSLGQAVQRRSLAPGTATLNLASLAAGVYTLRLQTEQGILTQRVVRE